MFQVADGAVKTGASHRKGEAAKGEWRFHEAELGGHGDTERKQTTSVTF